MSIIINSLRQNLPDITSCHTACFPNSLSTKLGRQYVQQTLDWFLNHPSRFLFHTEDNGTITGYCGGFVPAGFGDGSSSGMLQHAFTAACSGLLLHPWLLCHRELRPHYSFLWRNLKQRITGKRASAPTVQKAAPAAFQPYCGLVVIGVHPHYRGTGIAQQLMINFEQKAKRLQQQEIKLSVKRNNSAAIKAYGKAGWSICEAYAQTYIMAKALTPVQSGELSSLNI